MVDLEDEDLYFPNTKLIRDHLRGLNYRIKPINPRISRKPSEYASICFSEWVTQFEQLKQTNKMFYCMDEPNLTEDQSKFVMNILHVCPDYGTFKEAMEQYINKE